MAEERIEIECQKEKMNLDRPHHLVAVGGLHRIDYTVLKPSPTVCVQLPLRTCWHQKDKDISRNIYLSLYYLQPLQREHVPPSVISSNISILCRDYAL